MKNHTTEFADFLNSGQQFVVADLYSFYMRRPVWDSGLTFETHTAFYTNFDQNITWNGDTYAATGPLIERERVRSNVGMEVDSLNLRVYANENMLLDGAPFLVACLKGFLDGATMSLDRLYMNSAMEPQGSVNMFNGTVAPVNVSRSVAEIEVRSAIELLNINMPRALYQAGCQHTLYSNRCGANRLDYSANATADGSSTTSSVVPNGAMGSKPSGYWDLGGILFVSGLNTSVLRTVKSWDGSALELVSPLPYTPSDGDQFYVFAGCDKTVSTCTNKFNNVVNFKGFPFVPQPETMR